MQVVIDTVCIHHLLCSLKLSKISSKKDYYETSLDRPLKEGRCTLAVDEAGRLIDEWSRTCGEEHIKVLITQWEGFAALVLINPISKIPHSISRRLSFMSSIDRLVLRIGMATSDKIVVSDDSHFWDPACPGKRGDPNACIAKLCYERLSITVLLLETLLNDLERTNY